MISLYRRNKCFGDDFVFECPFSFRNGVEYHIIKNATQFGLDFAGDFAIMDDVDDDYGKGRWLNYYLCDEVLREEINQYSVFVKFDGTIVHDLEN